MSSKPLPQGPRDGDIFVVPLRAGGFGAARVINTQDGYTFLIANRFWESKPSAGDVEKFSVMDLPFGQRPIPGSDDVFKGWFEGRFPEEFEIIASTPLTQRERALARPEGTMVFQNAYHFAETLSDQWRWLHERAAFMEELSESESAYEEQRNARLEGLSLQKMLEEDPFPDWSGIWPEDAVNEARRIFRVATEKLLKLEKGSTRRKRMAVLKKVTDEFNRLDDETGCIESVERDQIVERIEELAMLVGLNNEDECLTGHRTW
jgi:hypothetical protein